jgi:hypothetical protein
MILRNLRGRLVDVQPEWVDYRLKEGFTIPRKKEIQREKPETEGKFIQGLPYI